MSNATVQTSSNTESAPREPSRTLRPTKHADGTKVEPGNITKRTSPPKTPIISNKPLLNQVLEREHQKTPTEPSPSNTVAPKDNTSSPKKPVTKQRRKTAPKAKAKAKAIAKVTIKTARCEPQVSQEQAQPFANQFPINLDPANPTCGFDALYLAGETRRQQANMRDCEDETKLIRNFLNKRLKDVCKGLEGFEDKSRDAEIGVLQCNLSIVEDALRRYPK